MSQKWWILAAVACGTFMSTLDSSIVNIALPTLTKEFGVDIHQVRWVVIIYQLLITCLLLPFGRLSDRFGRKPIFQLGFLVFTIGSALCASAQTLQHLVLSRTIQALGVSMLMANGPAIITASFPFRERGAALGTLAMVVSAGLLSGPGLGGLLISNFGWRSIFWVNLPVGLLGIALVHRFLISDRFPKERAPFDWAGALLQTIFLIFLISAFDPPSFKYSNQIPIHLPRWLAGIISLIALALFINVESKVKAPLFDLSLLESKTFWSANLASFLMFVSYSAVFVLMPFFLEEVLKFPTPLAGIFMTAIPLTIFVVAPLSGRMSDRFGGRWLSIAGAIIATLSLLSMSGMFGFGLYEKTTHAGAALFLCSLGLANGLFQSPNNSTIMGAVPADRLGVASAFLATVRNLGMVTGTGIATTLFSWRMEVTHDFVSSMQYTILVAGLTASLAIVFSTIRRTPKPLPLEKTS